MNQETKDGGYTGGPISDGGMDPRNAPAEQGGRVDGFETWAKPYGLESNSIAQKAWQAALAQSADEGKAQWDEVAHIIGADGDNVDDVFAKAKALAQNAQGEVVADAIYGADGLRDKLIELFYRERSSEDDATLADQVIALLPDRHAERARVPEGWRITPERNPLGGKSAMRLHAPDGRSALFGTFSEEVLARDFLNLLAATPSQPEDAA
jgi:hypothetical protein